MTNAISFTIDRKASQLINEFISDSLSPKILTRSYSSLNAKSMNNSIIY